jgi:hypothetical protein
LIRQVSQLPASYTVTASFTNTNSNYTGGGTGSKALTVNPRTIDPSNVKAGLYTGDVFAWTTSSSSSKATVTLIASLKDNAVPNGDLRAAKVTFYYVSNGIPTTPIPGAQNIPVGLVDVNDGSVGFASAIAQFDIGANNAQDFRVAVQVTGAYTNDAKQACAQALITVAKPIPGGFIAGGSQFENKLSSGYVKGHTGLNTEYQFDIQYTKSGSNPKGKAKVYVQSYYKADGTLDNKPHTYVISTNAIAVLNIVKATVNGTPAATGTFSAKANLDEYVVNGSTVTIVPIEGGATFQMEAYQNNCNQQVAITLFRKAGGIWYSSRWENGKTTRQQVNSNSKVFVEGGGSCTTNTIPVTYTNTAVGMNTDVTEVTDTKFGLTAFPNPTQNQFKVHVESSNRNDKIMLRVFDAYGRTVRLIRDAMAGQTITLGNEYRPGVYYIEMIQGKNRKQVKLLKVVY